MIELVDEKRQEELWQAYVERCTELRKLCEDGDFARLASARTDYIEGILDALEELEVEVLLELDLEEPYLCPLVEADRYGDSASDDECACYDAVDRHDMPTSCPRTIYGNEVPRGKPRFSAPDNCPLRKGPVLVRAKA